MADNVGYTPGSGAIIATDDVGGVQHQRIKISLGSDGVDDGMVSSANPMPITTASPLSVTGNFLTDAELRTAPIEVEVGSQSSIAMFFTRILNALAAPLGYAKDLQRYRATTLIESGTVTTVATVTTVSGLTNLNGLASDRLVTSENQIAWALTHRARIT
jgi:hypothetical protein